MIGYKELLIVILFFLLLFPASIGAKKRKSRKPESKLSEIVQTDSTGQLIRKKRAPEEIFDALNSVLEAITDDMDEFNFDKIHPHLKIVYALYNELRLLAFGGQDSLFDKSSSPVKDSITKKVNIYPRNNLSGSVNRGTSSGASDSSLKIILDSPNPTDESALKLSRLTPGIGPKNIDPSKQLKGKVAGNKPSSFSLSWSDTSFSKYLIKFEITQDSLVSIGWNLVFEKVDKLKNKTVKVHKYFDAGEFSISTQDLVWLIDEVKRAEVEIKNYFYAKEKEKKDDQ